MWARIIGLSFFFAGMMGLNPSWSAEIKFDEKNYADNMDLAIGISGTMKGDGVLYKNNTYAIWCMKDNKECLVTSIEQIGDNLMGRLEYPYSVPIIRWSDYEVVAATEVNTWTCVRTTITIMRNSKTATWVEERVNAGKGTCSSDKWVHKCGHTDDRDHLFRSIATSVARALTAPLDGGGDVSLLMAGQAR